MEHILEINTLCKVYPGFTLEDITFNLPRGYIMGLIGPNGAGKSTVIKLIMNLIKKDEGEIKVFGLDHIKEEKSIKERIGFVYDESNFYEELTLKEITSIISPFYKQWDECIFQEYIKHFELPLNKKIKNLSKGMKMKFSLALALSHHADLILMDEPTAGLDPVFRNEILEILSGLIQDENKGIIFSTHITTDLDKIADFITFINDGKLVFSKTKDALIEHYGVVKGGKDLLDRDTRKEFIGIRENHFGFEALTQDVEKTRQLFRDRVIIERPSLEDIMLFTVRGDHHVG